MNVPAPLLKKLRLSPGARALVTNPPPGYIEILLGALPDGASIETSRAGADPETTGSFDFVQLFVKNRSELDQLGPSTFAAVKYDGLLWVCYPKGSSGVATDINRDSLWKLMEPTRLRPVTQIAIDEIWSALRFRPAEAVGK